MRQLRRRDAQVRNPESAHQAAAGQYAAMFKVIPF